MLKGNLTGARVPGIVPQDFIERNPMNRIRLLSIVLLMIGSLFLSTTPVLAKNNTATYVVEVADIEKSADLLKVLKSKGIPAVLFPKSAGIVNEQTSRAVWIGKNVPLSIVMTTLLEAMKIYPYLCYFHVVGDRGEAPPERVHNIIHIGGSGEAAQAIELKAFDQAVIKKALAEVKTIEELHRYLHAMNRVPEPAANTTPAPQ
jgi:hypothetical protein